MGGSFNPPFFKSLDYHNFHIITVLNLDLSNLVSFLFPTKHTEFFKAYIVEALLIRKALLKSRLVFHFW